MIDNNKKRVKFVDNNDDDDEVKREDEEDEIADFTDHDSDTDDTESGDTDDTDMKSDTDVNDDNQEEEEENEEAESSTKKEVRVKKVHDAEAVTPLKKRAVKRYAEPEYHILVRILDSSYSHRPAQMDHCYPSFLLFSPRERSSLTAYGSFAVHK